jgi:hypothetical protein
VTGASFFVSDDAGRPVAGAVSASGRTAMFTPDAPLGLVGRYTATVTRELADPDGNPLAADYAWRFAVRDGIWDETRLVETNNAGDAANPDVAIDERGDALVVWQQSDGTRDNIWANHYTAGVWGEAKLLETGNGDATRARVARGNSGAGMAVWAQSNGTTYSIWANRHTAAEGWDTATLIEDNAYVARMPVVACNADGESVAVWEHYDTIRYNIRSNYTADGGIWVGDKVIESDNSANARDPRLAMDDSGNALAVWRQTDVIWSERYVAGSGWTTAEQINAEVGADADPPEIAMSRSGDAMAVWQATAGIGYNRYTPDTGWGESSLLTIDGGTEHGIPQVATGGQSTGRDITMVAWGQLDATDTRSVRAMVYNADTGWSEPATLAADLDSKTNKDVPMIRVAVDGQGNGFAVWQQVATDGTKTLHLSRYVAGAGWSDAANLSAGEAPPGNADYAPSLVVTPQGTAVIVWSESDGTHINIYSRVFR